MRFSRPSIGPFPVQKARAQIVRGLWMQDSLFQRHHGDAVFPFAVDPQAEGFHIFVPPQNIVDRFPQGAGALAVDDGHGLPLAHDGAGK